MSEKYLDFAGRTVDTPPSPVYSYSLSGGNFSNQNSDMK
jgi:hypothetical protein